jgi:DnaK suppressor protein
MPIMTKGVPGKFRAFEKQLKAKRDEIRERFARQLGNVQIEREPDDECAEANHNLTKHLALSTLDLDRNILSQIELALGRMKSGAYGVCDSCDAAIPNARLNAVPWARWCLQCAERAST